MEENQLFLKNKALFYGKLMFLESLEAIKRCFLEIIAILSRNNTTHMFSKPNLISKYLTQRVNLSSPHIIAEAAVVFQCLFMVAY